MEPLLQDLRYAVRTLRGSPGFALVAVLTLGLGIGANTAIFSVLNAVVLRPLPLPESHRLVNLGWSWGGEPIASVTALKFEYWREHSRVFEGLATYNQFTAEGPAGSPDEGLRGMNVSDDFFRVVGLQPVLGRGFTAEENRPGGPPVVVLSDATWRNHFGRDPRVVGGEIELDGLSHTVVGVMPPSFRFPYSPEFDGLLRPLRLVADPQDQGHNSSVLGRLRPGVTHEQARADLDRVLAGYRQDHPGHVGHDRERMTLMSFQDIFVGGFERLLWVLLGAIGFVLLIACANVANLLLARATGRQREISVRLALGAGRGRVVRQLLTESLVIALLAAVLGVALAAWGVGALLDLSPTPLPRQDEIGLDGRVLGFTLLIATLTGIGFGLAAALPATRPDLAHSLKEGGRTAGGTRGSGRIRSALVVSEAAIAVVLLSGAGLLISTFANLRAVDTGFRAENLVVASFPRAPVELRGAEAIAGFQEWVVEEIGALPGVHSVATTSVVPFMGQMNLPMTVDGRPEASESSIQIRMVSPRYFETLAVPVVRGRAFSDADRRGAAPVIIINESTARHYFPGEDPIGQRIHVAAVEGQPVIPGLDEPVREIVGVVGDVREMGLRQAAAARTLYVPQAQVPEMFASMPNLLVRTAGPAETSRALPGALQALDPRLPAPQVRRMTEVVGLSMGQERFVGTLLTVFAGIALLLTAVGIYGVIAYTVRQRTREIGVRVALGARPQDVVRLVTSQGMVPVVIGLALGIGAAFFATRVLEGIVFGVETHDPLTFALAILLLTGVALLASYLPARRATRVDPMIALRSE
jgi:putative ABC transport system permease protein